MGKMSSIEKLNKQINMLSNEDYDEVTIKKNTKETARRERVTISKGVTSRQNLLDDLVGEDEDTKVFAADKIHNKENSNSRTIKISKISDLKNKVSSYVNTGDADEKIENMLSMIFIILIIFLIIFIIFI